MKLRAALGAVALLGLLASCGPGKFADESAPLNVGAPLTSSDAAPAVPPSSAGVIPLSIRIPSIGVNNDHMMQIGLNPDKTLEVPPLNQPLLIGWFRLGPLPGDSALCSYTQGCVQSSVMNSHINSDGVQGGFAKLSQLKVGATIEVSRSDGKVAIFTVYKVMIFKKDAFPTRDIYGDGTGAVELRLITCGPNDLDRKAGSYRDQTVIKAKLKELRPA